MARQTFLLPGGTVASVTGHITDPEVRYGLELPNGVEVGVIARADHEGFPELVGSTVVTISTEEQGETGRQSDGEPRMCVMLNDAVLYDREALDPPAVATPWDTAIEAAIDRLLADYQIDGNYFAKGGTRYFAVLGAVIDGEQSAAATFDTLREATDWLSTGFDNDNPREPIVVIDIVTGQQYQPQTTVKVTLSEIEVQS